MSNPEKGTPTLFVTLGLEARNHATPEKLQLALRKISEDELEAGEFTSPTAEAIQYYSLTRTTKVVEKYGPGIVLEIDADESTIWTGTAKYIRPWPDAVARRRWAAKTEAVKRAAAAVRGAAKVGPFREALDPIREAYQNARGTHRTQLLAAVVQYLTS